MPALDASSCTDAAPNPPSASTWLSGVTTLSGLPRPAEHAHELDDDASTVEEVFDVRGRASCATTFGIWSWSAGAGWEERRHDIRDGPSVDQVCRRRVSPVGCRHVVTMPPRRGRGRAVNLAGVRTAMITSRAVPVLVTRTSPACRYLPVMTLPGP